MKDIPDALTSYNILIELTDQPQNQAAIDRNIAIVGTAFLEIELKQAITKHLRLPNISAKISPATITKI